MNKRVLAVLCFIAGMIVTPLIIFLYLRLGGPPVAVTDPAFPFEKQIVHIPLQARIAREAPKNVPLEATPEQLAAGAVIYKQNCAFCHGLPQHDSAYADHMYPPAPQLWKPHGRGVVGVSDDPPGETFWKVKNGIRLTAMPAYADLLSEDKMWQVTLLLSKADQPLTPEVKSQLVP